MNQKKCQMRFVRAFGWPVSTHRRGTCSPWKQRGSAEAVCYWAKRSRREGNSGSGKTSALCLVRRR